MTHFTLSPPKAGVDKTKTDAKGSSAGPAPLWLLIAIAVGLGLVLSYTRVLAVWDKGTFFDSDDAMRLVQVRALLHGQHWFDMTAYRLDPPHGVFMHWSRIVDLPLAFLIKSFSLFLSPAMAERATRIVFPVALQAFLYLGMARIAKSLIGQSAIIPALILTLLSGMELGQFQPGRIHHSAPQIMLSIFMLACLVEAFDSKRAYRAAIAGALMALSLATGLETLPLIAMLIALTVAIWIVRGADLQRALGFLGLGLGIALPLAFFSTVGPKHWFDSVCDAYSPVYLVTGIAGAAVLGGLALVTPWLATLPARLLAACCAAAIVIGAACALKPVCFIDPYYGIDPLVRSIWLKNVVEGFSMPRLFRQDAGAAVMLMLPICLGLGASAFALIRTRGLAQQRWVMVMGVTLASVGLSIWMIRMTSYAILMSLFGAVWLILSLRDAVTRTKWRDFAPLMLCLILPFSAIGWALVIPTKSDAADWHEGTGCLTSSAFAPLAQLPPGLVAAPLDAGAHMLVFTPQSVLTAPYHRDNIGNRAWFDAMLATPDEARGILAAHHVTYVMTCAGLGETKALAKRAPHGFAAALLSSHVPDWLTPVPEPGPYHVFALKR